MSLKIKDRLKHILVETEYLSRLAQRLDSKKDLEENEGLSRATNHSISILGEAVKTLPESIRQLSPNTQWSAIARMRDNIVHRYHDIDYDVVWEVIKIHAPALNQETTKIR